jgi:hypothetical protein
LLGHNSAPNPYFPPPPPEVLSYAEQSPDSGALLPDFQRAADKESGQADAAPPAAPQAPDLPEFRGLLSQFGRGLLKVGIGGLIPSPLLPDVERAADDERQQDAEAVQLPDGPNNGAQSSTSENDGELTGESGDQRNSPAPPIPAYKHDVFKGPKQQNSWADFNRAVADLPGASDNEKSAYREIFAAEGGTVPNGTTVAGIPEKTLHKLHFPGVGADTMPEDLDPQQQADFYRYYLDHVLRHGSGYETLGKIDHPGVAAFVADTAFRSGQGEGVSMIQQAINAVRKVQGKPGIDEDAKFSQATLDAMNDATRTPEGRQIFAARLKRLRDRKYTGEKWRTDHFYELVTQEPQ